MRLGKWVQLASVAGSGRPQGRKLQATNPAESGEDPQGLEPAETGNGQAEGRSARRQPNPLSTRRSGGTRASAQGTAKGSKPGRRTEARSERDRSRDASTEPRDVTAGFALPSSRTRTPSKFALMGTRPGPHRSFTSAGHPKPEPTGAAMPRPEPTGDEPWQQCPGENPDRTPPGFALAGPGPAQRRTPRLNPGLGGRSRDSGGWRKRQPPLVF